jgi:Protein of unknown function (DUF433)
LHTLYNNSTQVFLSELLYSYISGLRALALRGHVKVMNVDHKAIITIEPGKRGGKPCIRGMRIAV